MATSKIHYLFALNMLSCNSVRYGEMRYSLPMHHTHEVTGSSPVSPTIENECNDTQPNEGQSSCIDKPQEVISSADCRITQQDANSRNVSRQGSAKNIPELDALPPAVVAGLRGWHKLPGHIRTAVEALLKGASE